MAESLDYKLDQWAEEKQAGKGKKEKNHTISRCFSNTFKCTRTHFQSWESRHSCPSYSFVRHMHGGGGGDEVPADSRVPPVFTATLHKLLLSGNSAPVSWKAVKELPRHFCQHRCSFPPRSRWGVKWPTFPTSRVSAAIATTKQAWPVPQAVSTSGLVAWLCAAECDANVDAVLNEPIIFSPRGRDWSEGMDAACLISSSHLANKIWVGR